MYIFLIEDNVLASAAIWHCAYINFLLTCLPQTSNVNDCIYLLQPVQAVRANEQSSLCYVYDVYTDVYICCQNL